MNSYLTKLRVQCKMSRLRSSLSFFKAHLIYFFISYFLPTVFSRGCNSGQTNFLSTPRQNLAYTCPLPFSSSSCNPINIFYNADGSCNNIAHPRWGQVSSGFVRLVAANYADGKSQLRKSINGSSLPLARKISTEIFRNKIAYTNPFNVFYYGYGQWLDHDITLSTPQSIPMDCCNGVKPKSNIPSNLCLPTIIPSNDYYYQKFGVQCIDLKRSINTLTEGCFISPIHQINFQSAYTDLSIFYGASNLLTNTLRQNQGGRLKSQRQGNGQSFPPVIPSGCPVGGLTPNPGGSCFLQGDIRILQNPELTVNEIVFLRMHNYIADGLKAENPTWTDEKLFQWARKILIAIHQNIAYTEWIPPLIGPNAVKKFNLVPQSSGYAIGYDPTLNAQTAEEFEASAGRILHSLVRGSVSYTNSFGVLQTYNLKDKYFNQQFLLKGNTFTDVVRGYAISEGGEQNQFTTAELSNHLFISETQVFGQDLIAIDILRGRDHGLGTYNAYRKACGLCPVNDWNDLSNVIVNPVMNIKTLQNLYKNPEDIDFYVGGALEKPVSGGMVGPTMACIFGETFRRNKFGDRLFYEFKSSGFTEKQLSDIRNTLYSKLLCLTNNITAVAKNSFMVPSIQNPAVSCKSLGGLNFQLYKNS